MGQKQYEGKTKQGQYDFACFHFLTLFTSEDQLFDWLHSFHPQLW